MNSEDYIADLEEEARTLRSRVTELEEELRQTREELRVALERKVEETDEGVPPEEIIHQNRPKKEEATGSGLGIVAAKHEAKHEIKPKKLEPSIRDVTPLVPTKGGSAAQPQREPSPAHLQDDDDDVIVVDWVRQSPGKRKGGSDQSSPRPKKRQTFWVEVPPRPKRAPSVSVKRESSSPEVVPIEAEGAGLAVKQEPDQEASTALSAIRNTKIKPDKKSLDDVSVFTRLSRVGLEIFPVTIEDKIKELSVSCMWFLAPHFGGSAVQTHPRIGKKKLQQHGFDNFMYATLALHPNAPSFPGTPGLWMCICSDCADTMEDVRLIVRVQTTPALWQYMGQYDLRPSDPLSTQEWAMQSDQTKQEWVKCIHDENWGSLARARIKHRQLNGREPTGQEIENLLKDKDYGVTPMDIREAFEKGEERLHTWTLKCRGYDERFQREIWNEHGREIWNERRHKSKKKSKGSGGAAKNQRIHSKSRLG